MYIYIYKFRFDVFNFFFFRAMERINLSLKMQASKP